MVTINITAADRKFNNLGDKARKEIEKAIKDIIKDWDKDNIPDQAIEEYFDEGDFLNNLRQFLEKETIKKLKKKGYKIINDGDLE